MNLPRVGNSTRPWKALAVALITGATVIVTAWVTQAAPTNLFADSQVGEMQDIVSQNRDIFGGLAGDPLTNIVTIYIAPSADSTKRDTAIGRLSAIGTPTDAKFGSSEKHWSVRYVVAGPSLAVLDTANQRISSALPWRTDVGADLVSWGIDPSRHAVVVGVEAVTTALISETKTTFGDSVVITQRERPVRDASRLLDVTPYWAGDRTALSGNRYSECTAGFAAYDPNAGNHQGVLGMGHCYSSGTTVLQGYYDSNGSLHQSGNMGKVTRYSFSNNTVDAEFLDATTLGTTVQDWVYTTSTNGLQVRTTGTSYSGLRVCTDGSFTGQNCNGVVQSTEQCVYIYPYTTCHLTLATASSQLCQGGDSGGPVYTAYGTGLEAYGLIESSIPDGTQCYYSEIHDVVSALNVVVMAG